MTSMNWLDGHESEWTPGVGDGQGGLACCDSWGRKGLDTTDLIWSDLMVLKWSSNRWYLNSQDWTASSIMNGDRREMEEGWGPALGHPIIQEWSRKDREAAAGGRRRTRRVGRVAGQGGLRSSGVSMGRLHQCCFSRPLETCQGRSQMSSGDINPDGIVWNANEKWRHRAGWIQGIFTDGAELQWDIVSKEGASA